MCGAVFSAKMECSDLLVRGDLSCRVLGPQLKPAPNSFLQAMDMGSDWLVTELERTKIKGW